LGKSEVLKVLNAHLQVNRASRNLDEQRKIFVLCRLLFENPNGWKSPRLGRAEPSIDFAAVDRFPLFPITISEGVPFFLLTGYTLIGQGEPPDECLKMCEKLNLVSRDLEKHNFSKAAEVLIKSEAFQRLYSSPNDLKEMSDLMKLQASGDLPHKPK
jgi:hypothetical protein